MLSEIELLREFVQEYGRRDGRDDTLLPEDEQYRPFVREAMRLIESGDSGSMDLQLHYSLWLHNSLALGYVGSRYVVHVKDYLVEKSYEKGLAEASEIANHLRILVNFFAAGDGSEIYRSAEPEEMRDARKALERWDGLHVK